MSMPDFTLARGLASTYQTNHEPERLAMAVCVGYFEVEPRATSPTTNHRGRFHPSKLGAVRSMCLRREWSEG